MTQSLSGSLDGGGTGKGSGRASGKEDLDDFLLALADCHPQRSPTSVPKHAPPTPRLPQGACWDSPAGPPPTPTKGRRVHPRPHPQSRVNTVGGGLDLSCQSSTMWAGQQRVDSPLSKPRNGNCLKQWSSRSQPRVTRTEVQAIIVGLVDGGPWEGKVSRRINYTTSP